VSRPHLLICTRCERGDELYARVKKARRERGLKEAFKVEEVRCLDLCDNPCTFQLEGKKRSTIVRVGLLPKDSDAVVDVAAAFAALAPGEELPERALPGEHAD
jgi:predicted metal-binding protein